jgi:hypothetical protein
VTTVTLVTTTSIATTVTLVTTTSTSSATCT